MMSLRDWVIAKSRDEANIVAPCPHHMECPLMKNTRTWCHFSQMVKKYPNNVFARAPKERDYNSEKFCYLVVKKGKTPNSDPKATIADAKTPEDKSFFWPRLIRPVMKRQGHTIIDMCTP
jgi:ribosomal protein RSM22 (predicted rRNA methylase)